MPIQPFLWIWDMGYGMDIFMDGRRGRRRTLHRRVPGAIFNQKSITSAYVGYVWLERVGESGRRSMECIRARPRASSAG